MAQELDPWLQHTLRRAEAGLSLLHTGKQPSSRRSVLRAGNRSGLIVGIGNRSMTHETATQRAIENTWGQSAGPHPIPERWRPLFIRAFVKAALFAATTNHNITANGKYGVF